MQWARQLGAITRVRRAISKYFMQAPSLMSVPLTLKKDTRMNRYLSLRELQRFGQAGESEEPFIET